METITMQKKHFFTLIEILVATGIIAILAGIGFSGYSYAMASGREKATKSLIQQMTTALDTCYNQYGFYPSTAAYGTIKFTFAGDPGKIVSINFGSTEITSSVKDTTTKFIDTMNKLLDPQNIKASCGTDGILRDSWGNEIYYQYPGHINQTKYDIISAGADGKFSSTNADNLNTAIDKSKYIDGKDWICDDIANF